MILVRKIIKIPYICPNINKSLEFYMSFARKMPEFFITIARKIFSGILGGHVPPCPPPPVSYACGCDPNVLSMGRGNPAEKCHFLCGRMSLLEFVCLESLKKLGNFTLVRERSGKLWFACDMLPQL